ncbi:DnaT-like ssDNA-binding domain-containing protein [Buchnera aphidicola]|uniref:DnaT-like ssDNA-binding domain-containing protein n=1 Tax=Buchnera aphidicola TaxID=9 RepID=UPI0031B80AAC
MEIKKLNLFKVTIENFLKEPSKYLKKTKKKTILILEKNAPKTYIINNYILKKIFKKIKIYKKKIDNDISKKIISIEKFNSKNKIQNKFAMYKNWNPDKNFIKKAAMWGIEIKKKVSRSELNLFIDYWKAEGRILHHIQWEQKLAYSLKITRASKHNKNISKSNKIYIKKNYIPDGFRDK